MCTYIYILPFENWSEHFPFSPSHKSGLPHKYLWNTYAYSAGQSIAESKPQFFDLACAGGGGCEGSFGIRSILGQRNPIFVASLSRHNFPFLCNASFDDNSFSSSTCPSQKIESGVTRTVFDAVWPIQSMQSPAFPFLFLQKNQLIWRVKLSVGVWQYQGWKLMPYALLKSGQKYVGRKTRWYNRK